MLLKETLLIFAIHFTTLFILPGFFSGLLQFHCNVFYSGDRKTVQLLSLSIKTPGIVVKECLIILRTAGFCT